MNWQMIVYIVAVISLIVAKFIMQREEFMPYCLYVIMVVVLFAAFNVIF